MAFFILVWLVAGIAAAFLNIKTVIRDNGRYSNRDIPFTIYCVVGGIFTLIPIIVEFVNSSDDDLSFTKFINERFKNDN